MRTAAAPAPDTSMALAGAVRCPFEDGAVWSASFEPEQAGTECEGTDVQQRFDGSVDTTGKGGIVGMFCKVSTCVLNALAFELRRLPRVVTHGFCAERRRFVGFCALFSFLRFFTDGPCDATCYA